jgi:hypothetical protein
MIEREEMMNSTGNSSTTQVQAMTPSGISERQNEPKNLHLLAAQRQLYTEEKHRTYLWYAGATIIALLVTGALNAFSMYAALITLFAAIVAMGEILLLPVIKRRRTLAAGIQELFDCEVLQLPWNRALAQQPDPHEIDWAVERFKRRKNQAEEWDSLRNWYGYSPLIKTAALPLARIECQQENLYWDGGLRRFWRGLLWGGLAILLIFLLIIGIYTNLSVTQYFSGPLLLIIPIAFGILKTSVDHHRVMGRLAYLSDVLEHLREDSKKAPVVTKGDAMLIPTRDLQTEIYHHRCDDSPVPDEVYWWLRKRFLPPPVTP